MCDIIVLFGQVVGGKRRAWMEQGWMKCRNKIIRSGYHKSKPNIVPCYRLASTPSTIIIIIINDAR